MKRSSQHLNKTEIQILKFLMVKEEAGDKGYRTYSSDPKLLSFTKKSQSQISRALRSLEQKGLLRSTAQKPFRGTPVLFWIPYPSTLSKLFNLISQDGMGPLFAHAFIRRKHNPMPSYVIAGVFNVSKRTAQRWLKALKEHGLVRPSKPFRKSRKRYGHYPAYSLTKGQKPLSHWMEEKK